MGKDNRVKRIVRPRFEAPSHVTMLIRGIELLGPHRF